MKQIVFYAGWIVFFLSACVQKVKYLSPGSYELNTPHKYFMPSSLHEISGISFNISSDTIYSIEDENGKVYYTSLQNEKWQHTKFAKDGDYEDIAVCNNYVVVLRSDGVLFSFPFTELGREEAGHVQEWKDILPEGEYEALAATKDKKLYVLCKNCKKENESKTTAGYILQVSDSGTIAPAGNFVIDAGKIWSMGKEKEGKFEPSAMAYKESTNEWYILSSVNKMLVVADKDFSVKEVYALDPALYNQPEGICFDKNEFLYISNEAGEMKDGTVYEMKLMH